MGRNRVVLLLLPALFSQAFCLQCNSCEGEYDCVGPQVTCEGPSSACTTSVRKAAVSFLEFQTVKKGCARQLYQDESISLHSHLMALTHQARYCDSDNCNDESYFVSYPRPANQMRCQSCASQGFWCPEAARTQISCVGEQDQCLDLDITGNVGQFANMKLKGCANLPRCDETLSFFSGSRTIRASCCDTPLCNSYTPAVNLHSEAPNGLECYSCVDEDGSSYGCSNESMSKVQCTGIHNMCLEGIGTSRKGGLDLGLITFKGCASPAMCQSSLLSLVQELENTNVLCCQGSLCNSRIVDGVVMEPEIPADSADMTVTRECIPPTPTPSGPTSSPDCVYVDYEDETIEVVPAPFHPPPSPESHTDKEVVEAIHEKENREGSHASPADATDATRVVEDGSAVTTDLEKSGSGANTTSSGNHGSVVVLVPIVIRKKNTTVSASAETKEDLAASSKDQSEAQECEAYDEDDSVGEDVVVANEDHRVSSSGFTPRPGPSPTSTHGAGKMDVVPATGGPGEDVLVSGTEVSGTPVPKKKIPCKRPKQPSANLASSSGSGNHVAERSVKDDLQLSEIKDSGKTHYSKAFGLAGNLGLLSLSFLLAALLH